MGNLVTESVGVDLVQIEHSASLLSMVGAAVTYAYTLALEGTTYLKQLEECELD